MKPQTLLCLILATALVIVSARLVGRGTPTPVPADSTATARTEAHAVVHNIMTRASVRAFKPTPVSSSQIDTLLRAAMAAPSAMDKRPWRFVVVTDKAQLAALAKTNPYAGFVAQAPLAIVVCGDMTLAMDGGGRDNWLLDTSAATQNLLLAAHAMGLGAVWTGVWPSPDRSKALADVLHLPDHILPLCNVIIGYPIQPATPKDKWDASRVSYDTYGGQAAR